MYINFPDAVLDTQFGITLHLKNSSNYKLQCSIERKQLCDCKRTEVFVGISHRKLVYECPHRKTINVSPKDFVVEVYKIIISTLKQITLMINTRIKKDHKFYILICLLLCTKQTKYYSAAGNLSNTMTS